MLSMNIPTLSRSSLVLFKSSTEGIIKMSSCCRIPAKKPSTTWTCGLTPLELKNPVPSDIEIARSVQGKPIKELCEQIGVKDYDLYGNYKAKVKHDVDAKCLKEKRGKYVVVTGVTPTSFGEGKSTTTIGLAQALAHLKRNSFACIRQPSQGPTFGLKGGAAGGGYSQVWPMDEFNMHFTGDIHAVTAANNLIAAAIDARMFHESTQNDEDLFRRLVMKPGTKGEPTFTDAQKRRLAKLNIPADLKPNELSDEQKRLFARLDIDPKSISLCRVIDTNDRFLRAITVGQSPTEKGKTRETKFAISVASELMAILALSDDLNDMCRRVERMVIGFTSQGEPPRPVTCDDLCVSGAVCALLKDTIYPSIIQTLEGSPVLVHCGPFANVAHGNSSIIADRVALDLVGPDGFVVTEAGFASDVGFEKFMDIKCRASGLMPDCAVLVTTIRALKAHGRDLMGAGAQLSDMEAIEKGFINLNAHIANITKNFNVPVVVALNKFSGDRDDELKFVCEKAIESGAADCQVANNWAQGGKGAIELANSVIEVSSKEDKLPAKLLYQDKGLSIVDKIRLIAQQVYGATDIEMTDEAAKNIATFEANGYGDSPVCIAKTHLSISHDPKIKGAPKDYMFPIKSANLSAGAGFIYALAGEISTMPGLPTRPAFFDITLDEKSGEINGLF